MSQDSNNEWIETAFTDLLDIQGGTQPPKSQFIDAPKDGYIRLLQIRDFGTKPVPTYIPDKKNLKKCTTDDVLIGRYGASVGRICSGMTGAYNVALAKIISPSEIEKPFIRYFLQSEAFQRPLALLSRSAQNGFNKDDLSRFPFSLPPLAEQKKIAGRLDDLLGRVDRLKARLDAIPAILKRFRQSVLSAATSGKLTEEWRETHDVNAGEFVRKTKSANVHKAKRYEPSNPPGEIPESWSWERLGDMFGLKSGRTVSSSDELDSGDFPYFKVGDMNTPENSFWMLKTERYVSAKTVSQKSILPKGTIVFPKRGGAISTNKKRVLATDSLVDLNTMGLIVSEEVTRDYVFKWFLTVDLAQLNTGSTIPQVNNTDIEPLWIPIPPQVEQAEIVRRVKELFGFADRIEVRMAAAQQRVDRLTQSILAKAFRGELTADWRAQHPELITGENSAQALIDKIKATQANLKPKKRK